MKAQYNARVPARDEPDRFASPTLVGSDTDWYDHCQAAQSLLAEILGDCPGVGYLEVEDGPGRRLGRSLQVKLWPTFIFLRNGREVTRVIRLDSADVLEEVLESLIGEG